MNKEEALTEILAIAARNSLKPEDIVKAFKAEPEKARMQTGQMVNTLFAYLGGILIFSGIIILIGMKWDQISVSGHILLTLGIGFCAFMLGVVCGTRNQLEKAATPLYLLAAVLQPVGLGIFLQQFTTIVDPAKGILVLSSIMLLQQGLVFIATRRTFLLFTSLFFFYACFLSIFALLNVPYREAFLVLSSSLLMVSWSVNNSRHHALASLLFFWGSLIFLWITFDLIRLKPYEILYLGLCCFMILLAIRSVSKVLLINSTLALLGYISYFTGKNFPHTLGWPITLIILGFIFIALGTLVLRINRKYMVKDKK